MPQWTKDQLDAINAKGRAVTVSAAAGSGKTAVLVEKLLRILSNSEHPVSADSIVLATFTNDAADQMKQRLSAALSKALEDDPDNERLAVQLSLIPSAKISTIHSFCFDLIRENSAKLDIDSSFRVLDTSEERLLSLAAAENVFEEWFGSRREDMKRLTDFFCPGAKNQHSLEQLTSELKDKILALPFPEDQMDRITARYKFPPEQENDSLIDAYKSNGLMNIRKAAVLAEECISETLELYGSEGMEIDKIRKNTGLLEAECRQVTEIWDKSEECPDLIFSGDLIPEFDRITFYAHNNKNEKKEYSFDEKIIEGIKAKRKQYQNIIRESFGKFTYDDIKGDYIIHGEICEKLFALIKDIMVEERRIKSEKNALGFSDAEQLACELLCSRLPDGKIEKTALARTLSENISIVMIDEFQDSTAVQELIFRMLSKGGSAQKAGTNFFAVGDVKQSIYRFRSADPSIFLSNLKNSTYYSDDGSGEPAKIILNRNFRSSRHVVDFVNTVFNSIMSEQCGELDYGKDEGLVKGSDIPDDFGATEIIELPSPDTDDEDAPDLLSVEAQCVTERIKHLLDTGIITENGTERKVQPSDICILTRKNNNGALTECLEKNGIPAAGAADSEFLASREISVVINLLRCIDNPTLDIPLASVLMSPMFMFSAADMAKIRLKNGTGIYSDILEICEEADSLGDLDDRCRQFIDTLGELREFASSHNTEELIGRIYSKTDLMSVMNIYPDSAKKKANLRLLSVYAADHDSHGTGGTEGFLRLINNLQAAGKDFPSASSETSANAVAVKTIHKSKGLEYPFVFLCSTWTKFNKKDTAQRAVFSANHGAAFKISDPQRLAAYESFPRKAVSIIMEKALRDEEMMLLYVALTRAKYKLFITRRTDEKAVKQRESVTSLISRHSAKQDMAVNSGMSMSDWLETVYALFKNNGSGVFVKDGAEIIFTKGGYEKTAENENTAADDIQAAEYDGRAAKIYRENISSSYDLTLSATASKLTVSEISGAHYMPPAYVFTPDSENYRHIPSGITAAQAGTAVHSFMQYADIRALYNGRDDISRKIKEECERLCRKGLITPIQAKCVREDMIVTFLESSLCRSMVNSPEIYREKKFLVKISEINLDDSDLMVYNNSEGMLQGVADCVFREGDGFVLVDYKTDRNVTAEILAARYGRQLELYKRALSLILDKPVKRRCLYSFWLGREIEVTPD